jgi:hypothetical protein
MQDNLAPAGTWVLLHLNIIVIAKCGQSYAVSGISSGLKALAKSESLGE